VRISRGGDGDPLVIRTAELAPLIERAKTAFDAQHSIDTHVAASRSRHSDEFETVSSFGFWQWLVQETGLSEKTLRRIHTQETKHSTLLVADELLSGLGLPHAISSGLVHVIPNPHWSQVRWVQYLNETGCEPDELLS